MSPLDSSLLRSQLGTLSSFPSTNHTVGVPLAFVEYLLGMWVGGWAAEWVDDCHPRPWVLAEAGLENQAGVLEQSPGGSLEKKGAMWIVSGKRERQRSFGVPSRGVTFSADKNIKQCPCGVWRCCGNVVLLWILDTRGASQPVLAQRGSHLQEHSGGCTQERHGKMVHGICTD